MRLLPWLCAALLALAPEAGARPPDVAAKHWATDSIEAVLAERLMGLHEGKFHPRRYVTRYQLAELALRWLARVRAREREGEAPAPEADLQLELGDIPWDVPRTHASSPAVSLALGEGFLIPEPDGTFRGPRQITRYDAGVFAARVLSGPPPEPAPLPRDVPAEHPAAAATRVAVAAKILTLHPDVYKGENLVRRQELAVVLARLADATR